MEYPAANIVAKDTPQGEFYPSVLAHMTTDG